MEWHRSGEKCEYCGIVTAPARFYWKVEADGTKKPVSQQEVEDVYIRWAKENGVRIIGLQHTATHPVSEVARQILDATHCNTCGKEFSGRGRECSTCRSRRSRQKA